MSRRISGQTAGRYLDLLCDLLLVRRLAPWPANAGKRMVRSPKIFVLELRSGTRWAIECKRSLTPTPARGFHEGCKDLLPQEKLLIYPGRDSFPLGQSVECVPLPEAVVRLRMART